MTGKDILQMELTGSLNLLQEHIQAVSDQEWSARAIPEGNMLGFTLWHTARIIDWGIHCAIQGVPEVADRPEWRRLLASEAAYGAGIPAELAARVAKSVSREDVGGYLGAVRLAGLAWLKDVNEADLDRVPDLYEHQQANPRYVDPAVWAEVSSLAGLPAWHILARPCIMHIRLHIGEIDLTLQAVRARATA
jgi:hypothetical protein